MIVYNRFNINWISVWSIGKPKMLGFVYISHHTQEVCVCN